MDGQEIEKLIKLGKKLGLTRLKTQYFEAEYPTKETGLGRVEVQKPDTIAKKLMDSLPNAFIPAAHLGIPETEEVLTPPTEEQILHWSSGYDPEAEKQEQFKKYEKMNQVLKTPKAAARKSA